MDLANLKEKLWSVAPLELLNKFKEVFLAFWSYLFSPIKGSIGHFFGNRFSGPSIEAWQDDRLARKKRLIFLGLVGGAVIIFGLIIALIVAKSPKPDRTGFSSIATGLSIPPEELFTPSEPDFLPGFLPEKEPRRFWSLEDIRQYWKAPGNSGWWMEGIESTVDSLMEGVP